MFEETISAKRSFAGSKSCGRQQRSQMEFGNEETRRKNGLAKRRGAPTLGRGMKRFLRKALIGLAWLAAALVVLLALFYAEEDWRGARDWAACQKELAAKGESLDLRVLAPPGKPEDALSKAPIFAEKVSQPPTRFEGLIHRIHPSLFAWIRSTFIWEVMTTRDIRNLHVI